MYTMAIITANIFTISELVDRSRPRPNTKDITRCVLSHTPYPPWLAAKVLGQVGGLTVPDVVR